MGEFFKNEDQNNIAAVIGQPIKHSLSPIIHNAAFSHQKLNWSYSAIEVSKHELSDCFEEIRDNGIRGVSVTMPLKEAVIPFLDRVTPAATELEAVNCIFWDMDELVGHNTDGDGFVNSLIAETGDQISGTSFAIIGAGGAARSVIRSLKKASVGEIVVINRNQEKAKFASELGHPVAEVGTVEKIPRCKYIINATSIGMAETTNEGLMPFPMEYLNNNQTVIDLVYNPIMTPLLLQAKERGARVVTGVGMLIHQAALQYELWTGLKAPVAEMRTKAISQISKINTINE